MKVDFAPVKINSKSKEVVLEVLESGWLTSGKYVKLFEEKLSNYLGIETIVTSSCTISLEIAVAVIMKLTGKKLFLVPTWTFAATANAVLKNNGKIVFYDCNEEALFNYNDFEEKYLKYKEDLAGVVVVDYAGILPDYKKIREIIGDTFLISDAAHSIAGKLEGKHSSYWADFTAFSFYANKNLTCGEGGALAVKDKKLLKLAKTFRLHGINKETWDRYSGKSISFHYEIEEIGFKANLSDVLAAIGVVEMDYLDEYQRRRRKLYNIYQQNLKSNNNFKFVEHPDESGLHLVYLILNEGVDRDKVLLDFFNEGITLSYHYKPLHLHKAYSNNELILEKDCKTADKISNRQLSLPFSHNLNEEQIEYVVSFMNNYLF